MRIGCCLNMLGTPQDPVAISKFKDIAAAGYDYIELPVATIMALSESERNHLTNQIKSFNFKCPAACNLYPPSMSLMTCDYPHVVPNYLRQALDYLRPLGVDRLIFGSGEARKVPENMSAEEAEDRLTDIVLIMDTIAQEYDVNFIIESLRPQESNILNTLQETQTFLAKIKTDSIYMLADFYHMAHVNDGAKELEAVIDQIKHIHISRRTPTGERLIPTQWDDHELALLLVLKKHKYKKLLSVETPIDDLITQSRQFIRQVKALV